jgi:nucleoside triphosphatase
MKYRVVVVAVIQNKNGKYLICKKPKDKGIFPGQWALPGGGIDEKERMDEALHREIWEEVGLKISDITPLYFRDDVQKKHFPDGKVEEHYMIYLMFGCKALGLEVKLNQEFEEYAWVRQTRLNEYNLNRATVKTFKKLSLL